MPPNPFDSCRQRIDRALLHANRIESEWRAFLEKKPYSCSAKVDRKGRGELRINPANPPIPPVIALELGELLYQLRAALDGSVYAYAVAKSGKNPPPKKKNLGFPLCKTKARFKSDMGKMPIVTGQLRDLIEEVQPYKALKGLKPEWKFSDKCRALRILNEWASIDRHRKLHVVGCWTASRSVTLIPEAGCRIKNLTLAKGGFFKDKRKLASFELSGYKVGAEVKVDAKITPQIAVNEVPFPQTANAALFGRLKIIFSVVSRIVGHVERLS